MAYSEKKTGNDDYGTPGKATSLCITLSPDCKYYCAVEPLLPRDEEPVFFGEFDRKTCEFKRISKHIFHQPDELRQRYLSSIISPHNKYLYLLVMPDASGDIEKCDIKRVPIVNFVPDFDIIELVRRITASSHTRFRYAIDGNLYLCDEKRRSISRVVNVDGDNPVFEADIVVDDSHPYSIFSNVTQTFISSWVTSDYCYDGISATLSCNEVKYYCPTSATGQSFKWDFGDGTQSTETSPTHTYNAPGDYDVSVDVVFDDGASKTYTRKVTISPPPKQPCIIKE